MDIGSKSAFHETKGAYWDLKSWGRWRPIQNPLSSLISVCSPGGIREWDVTTKQTSFAWWNKQPVAYRRRWRSILYRYYRFLHSVHLQKETGKRIQKCHLQEAVVLNSASQDLQKKIHQVLGRSYWMRNMTTCYCNKMMFSSKPVQKYICIICNIFLLYILKTAV